MKHSLFLIAPLSMLALAACNKSEPRDVDDTKTVVSATPVELPPSITSEATYRCADSTVLYVDYFGKNEAADIRIGSETGPAVHVALPKAETPADDAAPAAPAGGQLKSEDGKTLLTINGKQINVKLADKGAQTCKS